MIRGIYFVGILIFTLKSCQFYEDNKLNHITDISDSTYLVCNSDLIINKFNFSPYEIRVKKKVANQWEIWF